MTRNQLQYHANREIERANRAREEETRRSNLATEKETNRSNQAKESENYRSNLAKETETNRANVTKESETHRSNVENESISRLGTEARAWADRAKGWKNLTVAADNILSSAPKMVKQFQDMGVVPNPGNIKDIASLLIKSIL